MKLYNELAEYYYSIEKENRDIDNDIIMIQSLVKDIKKPAILDLGCGTGEHLNKLTKLNINCTGIDSSDSMINIAKLRFPNSITFIKEDIRNFDFKNKFDMVISLFGSLDYLVEEKDINAAVKNTWRSLKSNGIGLFEVWNALPIKKIKEKSLDSVSKTKYNGMLIERQRGFKLLNHPNKTLVEVIYTYNIPGEKPIKDKHLMRAFTCKEITNYLKNNKFYIIAFYANSLMEPYNDMSNKIIVYFKK